MEKNTEKQENAIKTGVVDVGGGLRGIYTAIVWSMASGLSFMLLPQMHEWDKKSILARKI